MWRTAQAAMQGQSHIRTGVPCQDKTFCCRVGRCYVAALADGAGSAALSHFGAATATQSAAYYLAEHFEELFSVEGKREMIVPLMQHVLQALQQQSIEQSCKIEDLASTLLVVATKGCRYLVVHLGDGLIVAADDNEAKVASAPENGEFANTTIFTTSSSAINHMRVYRGYKPNIRGFLLMSDGASSRLYNRRDNSISPALFRLICAARSMSEAEFTLQLNQALEQTIRPATTDDCSMAFVAANFAAGTPFLQIPMIWQAEYVGLGLRSCYIPQALVYYHRVLRFLQMSHTRSEVAQYMGIRLVVVDMLLNTLISRLLIRRNEDDTYITVVNL